MVFGDPMDRETPIANTRNTYERDASNPLSSSVVTKFDVARNPEWSQPPWILRTSPICLPDHESPFTTNIHTAPEEQKPGQPSDVSPNLADFAEHRFIPEYVAIKGSTGRSYFRTILNHILAPERVARSFAVAPGKPNNKLESIPGWPYLDSRRLCEIDTEMIQYLVTTALRRGYSTQTAAHIRNVIRAIFSHAERTGCYAGANPATLVTVPAMIRREPRTLSLTQLKQVIEAMRYPEEEITLFELLTEMSLAEICGLQWKHLNLSNVGKLLESEFIPPKTIAVRKQCCRGKFGDVMDARRKLVHIPDLLCSSLRDLKTRKRFAAPDDFVLASRNGTPVNAENIVARRLKSIGRSLGMPGLSWWVFHRTGINLRSEWGRRFPEELEKILPLRKAAIRH
jgi:integrase